MHGDMRRYYSINKFFLSQIGGWPYQSKIVRVLVPCFVVVAQSVTLATQVLLLQYNWGDLSVAAEGIVLSSMFVGATVKLINIVVNNGKFRYLLQRMNKHWQLFRSQYELHILRHYANIGYKVTRYYAVFIYTCLITFMLIPLIPKILDAVIPLNESRPVIYVFEAEYGVDKEKYYYPILLHSYLSVIITIGIMVIIDTLYIVLVLHGCSLFNAISVRIENIVGNILNNGEKARHNFVREKHNSAKYSDDYWEMKTCLKRHQLALELVLLLIAIIFPGYIYLVNSMFSDVTFCVLFLNVLVMSLIGLQLINKLGQLQEVLRFGCIAVGSITHLLCLCLPGQLLIDKSTDVFNKAYNSQWHTFSLRTRKLLSILLYRSLIPCKLTAGKMYVISMTMCSSVIQTAISYFMAFLSLR